MKGGNRDREGIVTLGRSIRKWVFGVCMCVGESEKKRENVFKAKHCISICSPVLWLPGEQEAHPIGGAMPNSSGA